MKTIFKAAFAAVVLAGAGVAGTGVAFAQGYDDNNGYSNSNNGYTDSNGYYHDGNRSHRDYYFDRDGNRHEVTSRDYESHGRYTHRGQDYAGYHYYPSGSIQGRNWCWYYPNARGCRAM